MPRTSKPKKCFRSYSSDVVELDRDLKKVKIEVGHEDVMDVDREQ